MTGFGNGVVEEVLRGNLKCIYEGEPSPLTYQVVEELEKNQTFLFELVHISQLVIQFEPRILKNFEKEIVILYKTLCTAAMC